MRIAICTDQYLPLLSGLVDSVETLAHELRKKGHEVRIYCPTMPDALPDENVFRFPLLFSLGKSIFFAWPKGAMRDLEEFRPDIVHTELFGMAGFLAWRAARKLGVPLVGTDHTFPADYLHYARLDFPPFPYLVRKYAAWYYNRCDVVTAPSQKKLDELIAHGLTTRSLVISNPIRTVFRPMENKTGLKAKFGIGQNAIAVFGRVAPEKNLDAALDIFADVASRTDAELVFIGDGLYRPHLEARARELALSTRVKFLGTLRDGALVEALNACDTLLITSTSENQPMTLLQAAACGLPTVAAKAGGLPEYVHDRTTGFVIEPTDLKTFADRLVDLMNDELMRERFGASARLNAQFWYPDHVVAQFEQLYRSLIDKKEPGAASKQRPEITPAHAETA